MYLPQEQTILAFLDRYTDDVAIATAIGRLLISQKRFTQLDTGNSRKAGGAGLGLSIVKALVEAHGGELGLRSEPAVRTVFWFALPQSAAPA